MRLSARLVLEYARDRLDAEQLMDTIRFTGCVRYTAAAQSSLFDGSRTIGKGDTPSRAQHWSVPRRGCGEPARNLSTLRQRFPEQVQLVEDRPSDTRSCRSAR